VADPAATAAGPLNAEGTLPQGANLFKALFLEHPDGVALIVKGRIVLVNERFAEMSGYSAEEAIGMAPSELVVPEDKERLDDRIQELHEQGAVYPSAYTLLCKDGSRLPIDAYSNPIQHDGQTVLISVLRDISDQKQAEEAQQATTERLLKAQRVAKIGFLDWNLKTNDIVWSDQIYDLYGVDPRADGETLDSTIRLVHPDDLKFAEENLERATKGEQAYDIDHRILRPDGKVLWVHAQAELVWGADGNPESLLGTVVDITERKEAEQALRTSEERYRTLYELASDAFLNVHTNGEILDANVAAAELLGYTLEELKELSALHDIIAPEISEETMASLAKQLKEQDHFEVGTIWLRKDGSRVQVAVSGKPLTIDGQPLLQIIGRDITERKQAEEALLESEAKYHDLVETSQDMIWKCAADGRFTYLNGAWRETLGYELEEMLGRPFTDFQTPEAAAQDTQEFASHLAGGSVTGYETTHVSKSGEEVHLVFNAMPLFGADGNIVGTQGTAYNITARKRAEEALRLRSAAVEAAANGVVIADREGDIVWVNAAFTALTGYPFEEAIGQNPRLLRSGKHDQPFYKQLWDTVLAGQVWRGEIINQRKDGSFYTEEQAITPVSDEHGEITHFIAIKQDITDRKQAEEALRALQEERYDRLLEVAPDGIVIVDGAGVIETVNAKTEEMFGYDRSELIGRPVEMLIPERFHERHLAHRQAYTAAPHARQMGPEIDLYGLRKDGSGFPVDISLNTTRTADGVRVIAAVRDVAERVAAETALRESESTNRALLAAMPDMIFRIARDGTYLGFTPGATAMPIVEPNEFLGKSVREVIPQIAEQFLQAIERALDSRETQTLEYELAYGEELKFFEARINASGEKEALTIVRDITARRQAQESLRHSEARFSTAFHDNPVPVVISRVNDGKLIDVNDAFLSMTGQRRAETIGRTNIELGMQTDPAPLEDVAEAVRKHGTVMDFPAQLRLKTGDVLDVLATVTQIELEGQPCFLTTFVDITERTRLEHELRQMRDDLESKVERRMAGDNPYRLTFREYTVLHLIAAGKADKEIAAELGISIYTVHRHVSKILAKMDSPSRTEAGTRALREGLLD